MSKSSWLSPRVALLFSCLLVMMSSRSFVSPAGPWVGAPVVAALVVAAIITGIALLRPVVVSDVGRERRAARALVGALVMAGLFLTAGELARTIADTGSVSWFAVVLAYTIIGLAGVLSWTGRLSHMRWALLFVFLVAHTVMTVAFLRSSPANIDVQVYLHDGVIRLFHGQNPELLT
jgi:hypothetical protein